jgi:hypothetical protein
MVSLFQFRAGRQHSEPTLYITQRRGLTPHQFANSIIYLRVG